METLGPLLPGQLGVTEYLKAFAFGFAYLSLGAYQQCNTIYNRPLRACLVSLLMGGCVFAQTRYVATGAAHQFIAFQLGAACGVAVGIRWGRGERR